MKGMQKISRGRGFRGCLNYAFGRDGVLEGRIIGGNMSGRDPRSIAAEFAIAHQLRPDIKKPVWHNSLRLPAGEKISDEKWNEVCDDYMRRMGFTDLHPRVYLMHDDEDGQHIHIVASRVALDGKVYLGRNENLISTKIIAALERDHGLRITKGPEYRDGKVVMPEERGLKRGEVEKAIATGEKPNRLVLQEALKSAIQGRPTTAQFVERLELAGVGVIANIATTGKMNGFTFAINDVHFKASQLGDAYKWARLVDAIDYQPERDRALLEARKPAQKAPEATQEAPMVEMPADTSQDRRQAFKSRLIDQHYQAELAELIGPAAWVQARPDRFTIALPDGGRLIDTGDRVTASGMSDAAAAARLVEMVKAKGWTTATFNGSDAFRAEAYKLAIQAGITPAPNPADKEMVERVQRELRHEQQARTGGSVAVTANTSSRGDGGRAADADQPDRTADRGIAPANPRPDRQERGRAGERAGAGGPVDGGPVNGGPGGAGARPDLARRSAAGSGNGGDDIAGRQRQPPDPTQTTRRSTEVGPDGDAGGEQRSQGLREGRADAPPVAGVRRERPDGARSRVLDVAAPAQARRSQVEHGPDLAKNPRPIRPDEALKLRAVRQQLAALGAPSYRVTLTSRRDDLTTYNLGKGKGHDGGEKVYTAAEMEGLIPQLRRQNARGYDIYVTPLDPTHHFVVVDDLRPGALEALKKAGWTPALVQSSSADNRQAIIKAPRHDRGDEQSIANQLVGELNRSHGDHNFSGVIHPFRLAGFSNKKPGRNDAFTVVTEASGQTCGRAAAWLDRARAEADSRRQQQVRHARAPRAVDIIDTNHQPLFRADAAGEFSRRWARMQERVRAAGLPFDASRIDWQVTQQMLSAGWSASDVQRAIVAGSPNLADRHHAPMDYAERTVANAQSRLAVERAERESKRSKLK